MGDGKTLFGREINHTYSDDGAYTIKLTSLDTICNISRDRTRKVVISEYIESDEILPNVFTPNGDGINDVFFPSNIQLYPNNEVTIFNSNDDIVFSEVGYGLNSVVFPPNPNSTNFPEGTYRYKIVVENEDTYVNNGFFCLIKPLSIDDLSQYEGGFTSCTRASNFDPFLQ